MAGTATNPATAAGIDMPAGQIMTPSLANSLRIASVSKRLARHILGTPRNDVGEFFNLCVSLARGIDYAVANNDVPGRVHELSFLLKQVCQCRNDSLLQVALMVLMISAKSACKMGWFSANDSKELLKLANEMGSSFCSASDINTEPSASHSTISNVMSRFYPRMKMGQILAFLEAKPGYGAFVVDFHISKNAKYAPEDKIRLFVAQTDNMETSSCIISPPQVNLLLNGKGVEKRTNVIMDTGPQMPTTVGNFLKFGTNLLQAVGQFNGNYIILVAFMSVISNHDPPVLQDFVQPAITAMDSDSEIIEGPSRISLNCPISFRRIKIPVKGRFCKHLQCFDFDNFVDINSRRPSWRCPHCNQYVCYTDIRVDQNIAKVLREVGESVSDVLIAADGSWNAVVENNETQSDQPRDQISDCQVDRLSVQEPTNFSDNHPNILDLTEEDDEMGVGDTCETEDRKPFVGDLTSSILSPVLTDAITTTLDREFEAFLGSGLLNPVPQTQTSAVNNFQLQQSQFGSPVLGNEYGRYPSISGTVSRMPVAVQALPAGTHTPAPQQRPRTGLNNMVPPNGTLLPLNFTAQTCIADGFSVSPNNVERQQQHSRSHLNPSNFSSLQPRSATQNWSHQDLSTSGQPSQTIVGLPASPRFSNAYTLPASLPNTSSLPSPQQNSPLNLRMSHSVRMMVANQQSTQVARQPSVPTQTPRTAFSSPSNADALRTSMRDQRGNTGVTLQPVSEERNWRPTGRMRGSLQGQDYSDALNKFITQPTQPVQATRPPVSLNLPIPSIGNTSNALASHAVNFPLTPVTSVTSGSSVLPERPVE